MSQHDFDIANQGFAAFRADLNNALKALGSLSSATAEPATTYANQLWYETDTNILHIRNEANSAWLDLMVIDQTTGSPSFTAGNVGIGTASPSEELHIRAAVPTFRMEDSDNSAYTNLLFNGGSFAIDIDPTGLAGSSVFSVDIDGTEIFRANHVGNVGIGTATPGAKLELASGNAGLGILDATNRLRFTDNDPTLISGQSTGAIEWYTSDTDAPGVHAYIGTLGANTGAADLIFGTGVGGATAERARINSVGDLLIGKTATGVGTVGVELRPTGLAQFTRDGGTPIGINRITSNGEFIEFRKNGTVVGAIGVTSSGVNPFIGSDDVTLSFSAAGDTIIPTGTDGATRSGLIDLGNSANRWDTVYAAVGTINTSDRTEKQDIEELNDAERRVAVACKGLLRKYRLKSAIAKKGEDARIHFGIIAQDLQAAFEAEGLDAGRYGMFIHSTWTDEETGEEKSLMGVRYSELLAFMISVL